MKNLIYNTCLSDGIPDTLSKLIVSQAIHETANFQSNFFKKNNNAFGYSFVSGAKWQLPNGGNIADNGKKIASYSSVENSVHEITSWIKRRQNEGKFPKNLDEIQSPEQYSKLLKNSGYYGDSEKTYTNALKFFFDNLEELTITQKTIGISGIFLLLLSLFFIFRK